MEALLLTLALWTLTPVASGYFEALGADAYASSKKTMGRVRAALTSRGVDDADIEKAVRKGKGKSLTALSAALAADPALDAELRQLLSTMIQSSAIRWTADVTAKNSKDVTGIDVADGLAVGIQSIDVTVHATKSERVAGLRIGHDN